MLEEHDPMLDEVFMRSVLVGWQKNEICIYVMKRICIYLGLPDSKDNFSTAIDAIRTKTKKGKGTHMFWKYAVKGWLAQYYRPVSEKLWDGCSLEQAYDLWLKTPKHKLVYKTKARAAKEDGFGVAEAKYKKSQQAFSIGRKVWKSAYRARYDWKVVK